MIRGNHPWNRTSTLCTHFVFAGYNLNRKYILHVKKESSLTTEIFDSSTVPWSDWDYRIALAIQHHKKYTIPYTYNKQQNTLSTNPSLRLLSSSSILILCVNNLFMVAPSLQTPGDWGACSLYGTYGTRIHLSVARLLCVTAKKNKSYYVKSAAARRTEKTEEECQIQSIYREV